VRAAGAEAVACDLEKATVEEVAEAARRADAVVFAAGAGPGSGPQRKLIMDRDGAIKLLQATADRSVPYVIVRSVGAEEPPLPSDDDVFSVYLRGRQDPRRQRGRGTDRPGAHARDRVVRGGTQRVRDEQDAVSTGCGVVFISWLISQGHSLSPLAQAMVALGDSGTLAELYAQLTGDAATNAWPNFQAAVTALPGGVTGDNPFDAPLSV
jgi:NAD(P)H-binding